MVSKISPATGVTWIIKIKSVRTKTASGTEFSVQNKGYTYHLFPNTYGGLVGWMLVEKQVFLLRNVFVPQTVLRYLFFVNFLGGGGNKYPLSGSGYRLPRWESGKGRGSGPQSDLKINEIELN